MRNEELGIEQQCNVFSPLSSIAGLFRNRLQCVGLMWSSVALLSSPCSLLIYVSRSYCRARVFSYGCIPACSRREGTHVVLYCATGSCRCSMFAWFTFVFLHQIDAKLLKLLAELDKECPPPHTTARLLDTLVRPVVSQQHYAETEIPCGCWTT